MILIKKTIMRLTATGQPETVKNKEDMENCYNSRRLHEIRKYENIKWVLKKENKYCRKEAM